MAADHIGPYELRGELGSGAMARVWRGWDPTLRREVAIKEPVFDKSISPALRDEMGRRFADEACTAARLKHPGIVTIYAADVWDGRPAIVMELIEGETLASILRRGRLQPKDAIVVLDQLLDAVGYAHSHGVIHRDIKPDNIFVTSSGTVKLADFGIAHSDDPAISGGTMIGSILGTPGYMSPEQAAGQPADERSDLFSVGVVGYEMLTGYNPFGLSDGADATTLIYRTVHENVPSMPAVVAEGLPVDARPAIMSALAKRPADRPQTAGEFMALLHGRSLVQGFIPSARVAQDASQGNRLTSEAGSYQLFGSVGGYVQDAADGAAGSYAQAGAAGAGDGYAQAVRSAFQEDHTGYAQPSNQGAASADVYGAPVLQASGAPVRKAMPWWLPYAVVGGIACLVLAFVLGSALGGGGGRGYVNDDAVVGDVEVVTDATDDTADTDSTTADDQLGSAGVEVRGNLSEYSWDELCAIAVALEDCLSSSDAQTVAEEYNLVDSSGTYYSASKTIDMNDGRSLRVRLVGIWHDSADTPSGKAGLTFLTDDAQYHHRMSDLTTMPGGWQGSELREWLASDFYKQFPSDLSSHFVPVYKRTNNTGVSTSTSSVTETQDVLWVPSIVELTGPLNWEYYSHPENRDAYNAIFNAEGTQYPVFAQAGVISDSGNSILSHGEPWWTRSTAPASSRSRYVGTDGDPSQYGDANESWAVMVGFCL